VRREREKREHLGPFDDGGDGHELDLRVDAIGIVGLALVPVARWHHSSM
jgi:hypothetical protein